MLLTIIASVQKSFKRYFEYRKTMYELGRLTNRDLADLGIARGDIEYIARKHSMSKI
jgi:uncharacterized protein YjiS (DUF1127 family)